MRLKCRCVRQHPNRLEFQNQFTIDDDVTSHISYRVSLEHNGYNTFTLVLYTLLSQQDFHRLVVYTLVIARTESFIDVLSPCANIYVRHSIVDHLVFI